MSRVRRMAAVAYDIAASGALDGSPTGGAIGTPVALQRPEGHFDSLSFDWSVSTVFAGGAASAFAAWVGNEAVVTADANWQLLNVGLADDAADATSVTVTAAVNTYDHIIAWAGSFNGPQKISGLYILPVLLTTHTTGVFSLTTILASA